MKTLKNRGYTLLELMIVVVMVAILAGVTVPKLIQVSNRNKLGEVTNLFQQTVAEARALAMKNRRAVVVEVRPNALWVNQLNGTSCNDAIEVAGSVQKRCLHIVDTQGSDVIDLRTTEFQNAGVDMCSLRIAVVNASGACAIDNTDYSASGVALCFNGTGQLWIRNTIDAAADCTSTTPVDSAATWQKACVPWIGALGAVNAAENTWFSGADVRFNRFTAGTGNCPIGTVTPSGAEDVTRRVLVPAGGHPFVKMAQTNK